ncbi:MAG: ADP-L-glycero-D-manno-heptose-6-epimerase [Ignavibacteria bacterium]|nr:ADP-L-glycero-D-manno-heptose-6-epimerase [Ignavibacteria bacterium]
MIVLTGGAGFIGSCFLKKLNDEKIYDILVVDRLGTGLKWKNLVGKKFDRVEDKTVFRQRLSSGLYKGEIQAIVHLGACSDTTEQNADYLLDNNLSYSIELAEYAIEENIRLIYASSAATYGNGEEGYSDNSYENLKPLNIYGMTKHLFDLWVINNGLDKVFTGLKFFNVFGPNEYHKGEMSSMIYKAYLQIKNTGIVRLFKSQSPDYTDGCQMRDFVYVKDATQIMKDIFFNPEFYGIYNIGTGQARSWNDLANACFAALRLENNIEYFDMPNILEAQYQNFTQANITKLNDSQLNPQFDSLENNVADYITNYLTQKWQYL